MVSVMCVKKKRCNILIVLSPQQLWPGKRGPWAPILSISFYGHKDVKLCSTSKAGVACFPAALASLKIELLADRTFTLARHLILWGYGGICEICKVQYTGPSVSDQLRRPHRRSILISKGNSNKARYSCYLFLLLLFFCHKTRLKN